MERARSSKGNPFIKKENHAIQVNKGKGSAEGEAEGKRERIVRTPKGGSHRIRDKGDALGREPVAERKGKEPRVKDLRVSTDGKHFDVLQK